MRDGATHAHAAKRMKAREQGGLGSHTSSALPASPQCALLRSTKATSLSSAAKALSWARKTFWAAPSSDASIPVRADRAVSLVYWAQYIW